VRRLWPRLAIVLSVLGSAHFYIWQRFVAAPDLPRPWRTVATVAICVLAPSLPVAAIVMRRLSRATARPYTYLAYGWFGFAVYLLLGAGASHIAVATTLVSARTAALAGFAAAVATTAYGLWNARRGPIVRRVRVPIGKLAAAASGYTIVQLTDVHIGPTLGRAFTARVVAQVNALAPDLIVITGDLIDGRLDELREHVEPLRELHARDGVFAVTGNHEYYWNAEAWMAHVATLGIRVLRNERATIRGAFELVGVDDSTAGEDLPRALAGRDEALPVVLLAHHPSTIRRSAGLCDLQLSGHTHGGQILPAGWLSRLFEPHVAGLARFGTSWLYVSEGTGFWGPPMRVGTTCEIAHVTLDAAR
jgi:hypothetical protein